MLVLDPVKLTQKKCHGGAAQQRGNSVPLGMTLLSSHVQGGMASGLCLIQVAESPQGIGERGTAQRHLLLAARTWTDVGVDLWVPLPTATCGQSPSYCAGSEGVGAGCLRAETPLQVLASRTYRIPRVLPPCLLKTLL